MIPKHRKRRPPSDAIETILEDALAAIASGRMSVERAFRCWPESRVGLRKLAREIDATKGRPPMLPHIWHQEHLGASLEDELLARAHSRFMRIDGVRGVSWGNIYAGGYNQGRIGIVVSVAKKLPREAMVKKARLPRTFRTTVDGQSYQFEIDVQQIPVGQKHGLRAGNQVALSASTRLGTLSAVAEVGGRVYALLSGHVAGQPGTQIMATLPNGSTTNLGEVTLLLLNDEVDAAAVEGVSVADVPYLAIKEGSIRDLSSSAINEIISVVKISGPTSVAIDSIGVPVVDFGTQGGKMNGLIQLRDCVTYPGDSGAPALDASGNILGFVVGHAVIAGHSGVPHDHTYLIPARRALHVLP